MELDEMKNFWGEMSEKLEKQKVLTDKLIIKMTKEQYRSRISKIALFETLGAVFCFTAAFFTIINMDQMDTWYLVASSIVTIIILILLPVLSLRSVFKMNNLNISKNNYKEMLKDYTKHKAGFLFAQKLNYYLGFIVMLTALPVANKIINHEDMFLGTQTWLWYLPFGIAFFFFFTWWVLRHYRRTMNDAEELLKDLES